MNRRELLASMPWLAASLGAPASGAGVKSRFRTAICAYSFRDALKNKSMTYEDLVRLASDLDVDGLDLTVYWFPNTSDEFLMPLRRAAYKMGVDIYSISISTDMCKPPGDTRDAEIAKVRGWVDAAAKLGAGHIRVFGGHVPKDSTEADAATWCADTLKVCAEYSGGKGVILGLENHGGITERAETIIQIVKKVDSPWVGINLDTGNFDRDGYNQIEMCVPYAVNVQVKVDIRVEAGKPEKQDWGRIAAMLAKGGYRGYLALEYEDKDDPASVMPRLMSELTKIARKYTA